MNNWDKQIYNFAAAVISSTDPVNTFLSNRDIVIKYKPIVLLFDVKQIEKRIIHSLKNIKMTHIKLSQLQIIKI